VQLQGRLQSGRTDLFDQGVQLAKIGYRLQGSGCVLVGFGQGGHDGEVVGDDIVHLAGDPGAFGGRGERGLLVCLAFQPFRTVLELGEVGTAGGDVQAEP
jgi:hypothetical protein